MDTLHFGIRSGKAGSAADHIAYVTRKGRFAARNDLVATGHGNMPAFAQDDPELLWKASDKFERKNGSRFRSFTISLPRALTVEALVELSWENARLLAGTKPFQFALHIPPSTLDDGFNPHVHIVICDRIPDGHERPPERMFKRYNPTSPLSGGCKKDSGGRSPLELKARLRSQRKAVVETINNKLKSQGLLARVDHRTLSERGIRRPPTPYLGRAKIKALKAEKSERQATDPGTLRSE